MGRTFSLSLAGSVCVKVYGRSVMNKEFYLKRTIVVNKLGPQNLDEERDSYNWGLRPKTTMMEENVQGRKESGSDVEEATEKREMMCPRSGTANRGRKTGTHSRVVVGVFSRETTENETGRKRKDGESVFVRHGRRQREDSQTRRKPGSNATEDGRKGQGASCSSSTSLPMAGGTKAAWCSDSSSTSLPMVGGTKAAWCSDSSSTSLPMAGGTQAAWCSDSSSTSLPMVGGTQAAWWSDRSSTILPMGYAGRHGTWKSDGASTSSTNGVRWSTWYVEVNGASTSLPMGYGGRHGTWQSDGAHTSLPMATDGRHGVWRSDGSYTNLPRERRGGRGRATFVEEFLRVPELKTDVMVRLTTPAEDGRMFQESDEQRQRRQVGEMSEVQERCRDWRKRQEVHEELRKVQNRVGQVDKRLREVVNTEDFHCKCCSKNKAGDWD